MNWNDWEMIWKREELPRGADADLATLRETFDAKSRKLAKGLLARDILEASAGVFGAGALALIWWKQGRAGWPTGVSIILVLGVSGVFLRERLRAHRSRLGPDAPMLARLEAEMAELRHQRRLFLGMWQWYLAPVGAAIVIVSLTIARSRPAWDISRDPLFLGGYFAFCGLLFWGVWVANRRAVRKRVEPRLVELEKLRADLGAD